MTDKVYQVLFICRENAGRSQLAEALLNHLGHGRFRAHSAGTQPLGRLHPQAEALLHQIGYGTQELRSKGLEEFSGAGAPLMDFIITVCDEAAGEPCPVWPGHPVSAHWHFADPSKVTGGDQAEHEAWHQAVQEIRNRVMLFAALPISKLDHAARRQAVNTLGHTA
jgi:arsenate reductase